MTNRTARSKATGTAADREPSTLQQAHDVLRRQRPQATASADRWRAHYEKAARIYASVAELDDAHHFEALAFAGMAQEDAEQFSTKKFDADKVDHVPDAAKKPNSLVHRDGCAVPGKAAARARQQPEPDSKD